MSASTAELAELRRLVAELGEGEAEPFAPQDSPTAASAAAETMVAAGASPTGDVGLALADCLAGRGSGPSFALPTAAQPRFEAEKAVAQMAAALPLPPAPAKTPSKRPWWLDPKD